MTPVELQHGAASDVGLVRDVNEDAYLVAPPVFVVADGMGGHDHGDVASRFVIEELATLAEEQYDAGAGAEAVASAFRSVQSRIDAYDAAQHSAGDPLFSAGTTAVVALLVEGAVGPRWLVANVGDSRAYRFAGGELEQVSVDHSLVQELVDAGTIPAGDAAGHPDRHIVTRALGGEVSAEADYFWLPLAASERLLLCSDGICDMIDDAEIAEILADCEDPGEAADTVVTAAVAAGGRDNATAVVIDVVGLDNDKPYDSDAQRMSQEQKVGAHP